MVKNIVLFFGLLMENIDISYDSCHNSRFTH